MRSAVPSYPMAIYQTRRRNKLHQGNHHHPTYRKERSTEACTTVTAVRNQVVLDASLCKTSVTLSHCWYLLTSLSKWTVSSDSGQFAAPPSSREIRLGCGYRHSDVYLKICHISGKPPSLRGTQTADALIFSSREISVTNCVLFTG